jgi:hypothetical protein
MTIGASVTAADACCMSAGTAVTNTTATLANLKHKGMWAMSAIFDAIPSCRELIDTDNILNELTKRTGITERDANIIVDLAVLATDNARRSFHSTLETMPEDHNHVQAALIGLQMVQSMGMLETQMLAELAVEYGGTVLRQKADGSHDVMGGVPKRDAH